MKTCFLVLCLAMAACRPSEVAHSDVRVEWEIAPDPPAAGMATLTITLTDSTEQRLTGAEIEVQGNMTHPGMQPVITTAREVAPGLYKAAFDFTMGGDWFILLRSTLTDKRVVESTIDIPGVRSE